MLTRYDSVPIKKLTLDPNTGFLNAKDVPIARVGVFPYMRQDGTVHMEAKLPEDLLSDSTVESANNKPVTDEHPHELVTKDNADNLMKGFTATNAHVDGDRLRVDMTITDSKLIKEVNDGKQELSIGFSTEISPVSGNYNGTRYDCAQKNIQINHVAVVGRGRAGHSIRLTGDSAEMVEDYVNESEDTQQMEFTKVRIDDADIKVASEDADKLIKLDADKKAKADDLDKQISALTAELNKLKQEKADRDKAQAETDKQASANQAKADALEKELADMKKKYTGDGLDKVIADRMDLVNKVKGYVGDSYDFKGKTAKQMKIDAIQSANPKVDLTDKSDTYVDAYFDSLTDIKPAKVSGYTGSEVKGDSMQDLEEATEKARNDIYGF